MKKQTLNEIRRMQKIAGLLKEEHVIHFIKSFEGGGNGHGEEYSELVVYEKANNVVFKFGDPSFDGVPSTVYVMSNKNIYNAMDILSKMGYPVLDDKIELKSDDEEEEIFNLLDQLVDKGLAFEFNPEIKIKTKKDVDRYNTYLPDDEQYEYEDFGI
jgi:hypothetical protein